ncbi:MAG: TetR/AcrR family transcriptional regulator [Nannocystaceae bacterium]|nr:TetR/AcrR family transcriptional regulator [Nannocystaceae bacterium]
MRPQRGKQKLLESATRLFASQGYFATTVEQIAAGADVSKGLVYNYFNSKEELLVALIEDATSKIVAVSEPLTLNTPLEDSLSAFVDNFFRFLETERQFLKLQLSLLLAPELSEIVSEPQRRRAELLLATVRGWFQRARVPQPKNKARVFLAMLDGVALHYLFIYEPYPLAALKPQIMQTARNLYADPSRAEPQ